MTEFDRKFPRLETVLFGIAVPALLIYAAHFFFVSSYTGGWTISQFLQKYHFSIYQYRIVGRELVEVFIPLNQHLPLSAITVFGVGEHFQEFSRPLYWAVFEVNALFWVGTCLLWWRLLHRWLETTYQALAVYFFLLVTGVLSMFVVVPYDMAALFFLTVTIWLYHSPSRWVLPGLVVVTIVGSATRETQILAVSYAGLMVVANGYRKPDWYKLGVIFGSFTATYLGLRLALGFGTGVGRQPHLASNLTTFGDQVGILVAILLLAGSISVVPKFSGSGWGISGLVILAVWPYLLFILTFGQMQEIRLIVPAVVVVVLSLSRFFVDNVNPELADLTAGMRRAWSVIRPQFR